MFFFGCKSVFNIVQVAKIRTVLFLVTHILRTAEGMRLLYNLKHFLQRGGTRNVRIHHKFGVVVAHKTHNNGLTF